MTPPRKIPCSITGQCFQLELVNSKGMVKSLLLVLLVWTSADCTGEESGKLLRYSTELFGEMDYYRAITEYRRYLSYYPDAPDTTVARLRIFDAYYLAGHYSEAIEWGRNVSGYYGRGTLPQCQIQLRLGECEVKLENPTAAHAAFREASICNDAEVTSRALYRTGISYLMDKEWKGAEQTFSSIPVETVWGERAHRAIAKIREARASPRKNPLTAAVLGLVPGLGYAYVGQPQTGLAALVVNGLSLVATFSAFSHGQAGLGSALGLLSVGWYSGSIYGARVGALKWNHRAEVKLLDDLYYP
jgi:tetratricopeptide (TPR) repeat protein